MSAVSLLKPFAFAVLSGVISVSGSLTPAPLQPTHDVKYSLSGANGSNDLNWAGYVATDGTYTAVSGSWTVPTVENSGAENVADATWVGVGGVTSTDLIQAGTEAVPGSQGGLVYQAWFETLPQGSQVVPLSISPGDTVSVSVTEASPGTWEISFDDSTTGQTYETNVQYDSSLSSADWVEEMPVEVGGVIGLDDFGTVDFTSGYAIKNGQAVTIATSGATPLTMSNSSGEAVAMPSALGVGGASFSVSRTSAASTPLALSRNGISVVAAASAPYSYASSAGNYEHGGYTMRVHRGRGGYRIIVQF